MRSAIHSTFPERTSLLDTEQQQSTLQLIDKRQDLVLEDLNRLNQRIINIIEVYTGNRKPGEASEQGVSVHQDTAA